MSLQENIEKLSDSVKTENQQCRYWMVRPMLELTLICS